MNLYEQWNEQANSKSSPEEYKAFWNEYLSKEKHNYEYILNHHTEVFAGTLKELAEKFNMDPITFTGFLDGINTSLTEEIQLDTLTEESLLSLSINFEKLYYNMLDAHAQWLYNLPEWDHILSIETRKEIKKEHNKTRTYVRSEKIGRNEPCPCGSGKKYKKCCGK